MLTQIKLQLAQRLEKIIDIDSSQILSLFESPKNPDYGQLALPVFFLSKVRKKAPPQIAQELSNKIAEAKIEGIDSVDSVSGFINFQLNVETMQRLVVSEILQANENFGFTNLGRGEKVVIDYSSPNVAKPMSIGHLRATVIGQAICNLAQAQGYEVIRLNHLGDWGTQFGKLAWAYQNWGSEYDFKEKAFESLYALYVRFHEEAEKDPRLDIWGAETFKKLEEGDAEISQLWQWFVDISMSQYQSLWDILGVKHDIVLGESFYNNKLKPTIERLKKTGLLEESQGALVVKMNDLKAPPCLIQKSDGASLYATRDIASAIYRVEEMKAKSCIYVVGMEQSLHFKQIFEVMDKLGFQDGHQFYHVGFGLYKFKDLGKMSSRKGKVIRLEDVLSKAIEMVKKIIEEKNPNLQDKEKVATQVGVGAIIFNDLVNDRVKNVDFNWDRVLDFEGNSGPYVQYSYVRCQSILRKAEEEKIVLDHQMPVALNSAEEKELIRLLLIFDEVVNNSFESFKPHILATYLLDVCRQFSTLYSRHKILQAETELLRSSRLALVSATAKVIRQGLKVLNIEVPEYM